LPFITYEVFKTLELTKHFSVLVPSWIFEPEFNLIMWI